LKTIWKFSVYFYVVGETVHHVRILKTSSAYKIIYNTNVYVILITFLFDFSMIRLFINELHPIGFFAPNLPPSSVNYSD